MLGRTVAPRVPCSAARVTAAAVNGVRPDERQPPHDLGAERVALGAMLLSSQAIDDLLDVVQPDDHYRPAHQQIHEAIHDLHRRGDPVDAVSVGHELARRGELVRVGGGPYLLELMGVVATASNVAYYGEIVRENAARRRLLEAGLRLQQLAHLATEDVDDILSRAQQSLVGIATTSGAAGRSRLVSGGAFIHDATDHVPALWGRDEDVLWAEGEPLMLTGPTGVGKTTIAGQLVAARIGFTDTALGFPVAPGRRLLYLAMDRPAQIRRAHRRRFRDYPRELLDERLVVWQGPPPADLAREPERLLDLARQAGADTVVIDSLKDAAIKLSDEETGQGINRAFQLCVANDVEVLALHHQTKRGGGGQGKPNSLADVYGSAWITAGCGSVLLLWGSAGDLVVELSHLKQPAGVVGPLKVVHDPAAGASHVRDHVEVADLLDDTPRAVREIAMVLHGGDGPATDSDVERTRRALERLVRDGGAVRIAGAPGAPVTYSRHGPRGVTPLFDRAEAMGT